MTQLDQTDVINGLIMANLLFTAFRSLIAERIKNIGIKLAEGVDEVIGGFGVQDAVVAHEEVVTILETALEYINDNEKLLSDDYTDWEELDETEPDDPLIYQLKTFNKLKQDLENDTLALKTNHDDGFGNPKLFYYKEIHPKFSMISERQKKALGSRQGGKNSVYQVRGIAACKPGSNSCLPGTGAGRQAQPMSINKRDPLVLFKYKIECWM